MTAATPGRPPQFADDGDQHHERNQNDVVVEGSRDRNGLVVLSRQECFQLLETVTIGRVALSIDALPAVLPVNFALESDSVVFRTGPGSKLEAATRHAVVAFQADQIDPSTQTGWSVLLIGFAHPVDDPAALVHLRSLPLRPWTGETADQFVRIPATRLTGRRIPPDRERR